jgi:UTP--glucose-1-phosphate uridylyltransferase
MAATRITKVVIPAAGLGTRLLPATKVVPKEILPIAGRPLIEYAVEEAAASGIETIVLVVGPGKELIREYFQRDLPLKDALADPGWDLEATKIRRLMELVEIKTVWQAKPIGLANAIALAQPVVGHEAFAVILPDALIDAEVPCLRQLIDCYSAHPGCVLAARSIQADEIERFGIVEGEPASASDSRVLRVASLMERPTLSATKSRTGIFGRYVLLPEIFTYISRLKPGRGGEFQLTDALSACAQSLPVYAYRFEGEHFDVGNRLGLIQATVRYALKDTTLAGPLISSLSKFGFVVETPENYKVSSR